MSIFANRPRLLAEKPARELFAGRICAVDGLFPQFPMPRHRFWFIGRLGNNVNNFMLSVDVVLSQPFIKAGWRNARRLFRFNVLDFQQRIGHVLRTVNPLCSLSC